MKLKLHSKKEEMENVITLGFTPKESLTWTAGQYMHYMLPHENTDNRGDERWFTISSAPFEKEITLTTRNSGEEGSSFKKALFALEVGDEIETDAPEGDFVISDPENFVFIAGGIGITPFRSILLDLDIKGESIKGRLLYGTRDGDILFKEEMDALARRHPDFVVSYVIHPEQVDEEYIRKEITDIQTATFYISGPKPMVDALDAALTSIGVTGDHIKLDDFSGYEWPHA